ncbi:MAG: DUF504 domain-containing protein [Promethearchaeota archaeon]
MSIRDLLNQFLWDEDFKKKKDNYIIIYIHRGAPNDERIVNLNEITKVTKDSFCFDDIEYEIETCIPFHRIIRIESVDKSEILYQKRILSHKKK